MQDSTPFHVSPYQVLWWISKDGTECGDVLVREVGKNTFSVEYKGKTHTRDKSILGKKLFHEKPVFNEKNGRYEPRKPVILTAPISEKHEVIEDPITISQNDPYDERKPLTCNDCNLRANGSCTSLGRAICGDFRIRSIVSNKERELWPEYGDATLFRMKNHKPKKEI